MQQNEIAEFGYLWDGSSPSWVLLHVNVTEEAEDPEYLIVNIKERNTLLIGNDDLYERVIQQMLLSGVRIVSNGNEY
jgi:hypothetical protein